MSHNATLNGQRHFIIIGGETYVVVANCSIYYDAGESKQDEDQTKSKQQATTHGKVNLEFIYIHISYNNYRFLVIDLKYLHKYDA